MTTEERRRARNIENHRLYRSRHYRAPYGAGVRKDDSRIVVPADVVVLDSHEPCLACGQARGACEHRPWLLQA